MSAPTEAGEAHHPQLIQPCLAIMQLNSRTPTPRATEINRLARVAFAL